jgi:hypothetical protein
MAQHNKLPQFQFPGQIVIDAYGVIYSYNDRADCFVNTGSVEDIPNASYDDTGLMVPQHKMTLDNIPEKAGGFAIIVDPRLRPISQDNPDGLIYGDIKLVSESVSMTCLDINGQPLQSDCYACIDGENPPGFNLELSQKFLDHFCARLPVISGPRGDKGETGNRGDPGTGDGPVGAQGDAGISYDVASTFTGVKVLDADGVFEYAVVSLDLDSNNGILSVTKAKVATGDSTSPADQVYCAPIVRNVEFDPVYPVCGEGGDIWRYNITKGDDELPEDVYLFRFPDRYAPPAETEFTTLFLSGLINAIIEDVSVDYEAAVAKYDAQIKEYIYEKDEEARQKICTLAKQLSECEWELPIEYCLGITPAECGSRTNNIVNELKDINETLQVIGYEPLEDGTLLEESGIQNRMVEINDTLMDMGPFVPSPSSSSSSSSSP